MPAFDRADDDSTGNDVTAANLDRSNGISEVLTDENTTLIDGERSRKQSPNATNIAATRSTLPLPLVLSEVGDDMWGITLV
jgi:hypothetical protein